MAMINKSYGEEDGKPPNNEKIKKETSKKINNLINGLNKKFVSKDEEDEGVVLASQAIIPAIPIPTPYKQFNEATGINGMPNNGVVEISGEEGIGKTWLALVTIGMAQKVIPDRGCFLADLEGSSNIDRLKVAGIDTDNLYMISPCVGEALFEKILTIIDSGLASVIVIDSIPALQPREIYDTTIGSPKYGPIAKLLSESLRKIAARCRQKNVLLILINQIRQNIGASQFEVQSVTTGGKAIKFYAHMRIALKKYYDPTRKVKYQIEDTAKNVIGHRVTAKIIKNRYGPPLKEGMFEVLYQDPDLATEVIKQAKKAGLWKIYKGDYKYVSLDEDLIIGRDEDEFFRRIVKGGKLVEMAGRLIKAQEDTQEKYLSDEFDMRKLIIIQENERKKFDFLNRKDSKIELSEEEDDDGEEFEEEEGIEI